MRITAALVMLALLAALGTANMAFAVEDDDDGGFRQSKMLTLEGDEPPPPPKPKLIVKERVVMKCAPGTVWSPRNKRCISEDGEAPPAPRYQAPAPRQQAEAPRGDRYVYPGTKLRIKMGKCTMSGETVTCELAVTNTAESDTRLVLENTTIRDDAGESYKMKDWSMISGFWYSHVRYGATGNFNTVFPLVNPSATSVNFTMLIKANNGSDLVKFGNIPLIK
ncbi:MAG: hypothetical protein PHN92_00400 [Geobacter sp.]|nr:hypothetical protein [Geobacter sp.]